jgi:toxin ParE1/3/4
LARSVRLRALAAADIETTSDYYVDLVSEQTALEFIDAVERGIRRISRSPNVGSLHFAYELALPGVRAWPLQRFPYVVFYVAASDEIDVWRVLHSRRDLSEALQRPDE